MQETKETLVRSLSREDPLEKGMEILVATPVFLPENPMDRGAPRAIVNGVTKS